MDTTLTYRGYEIRAREIDFNREKLKYFVTCSSSEYGDYYETNFFKETVKLTKKKFWSRKTYEVEEPLILFYIPHNANDQMLTKSWWRERIQRELELLGRKQELENGQLI